MLLLANAHNLALFSTEEPHHSSGSEVDILHHIQDSVLVDLPTVYGVNLSITKNVLMMWIAAAILAVLLTLAFRKKTTVHHGIGNFFEAIVAYLREEILLPYLGEKGRPYVPYLLTAFFFILTCNLLGLVPMGASATGNISVTVGMALLTLSMVQISGIRQHGFWGYLKGIIPPNLPWFVIPIMIPVEIIGMCTKHIALAIRLFANMTAGHLVALTMLSLIFMFKSYFVAPFPICGVVFVNLLDILISLIQAYIFTILSAVFIGASIHQDH